MSAVHSIFPRCIYPEAVLKTALVVDPDVVASTLLQKRLGRMGYEVHVTNDSEQGLEIYGQNSIDIVFVAADYVDDAGSRLVQKLRDRIGESFIPVVITCRTEQEQGIDDYIDAGADDCLVRPISDKAFEKRVHNLMRLHEMHNVYTLTLEEQEVGKKIHTAAISTRLLEVDPIRSINRSAGVFSGDLILIARKPNGNIHVMLADFTGHGLSAAIGALPVADTFCVMTEKGFRPDVIIRQLNRKLYTLLPTSMFMSMALIQVTPDLDEVHVWNAGMPHIYKIGGQSNKIDQVIRSSSVPLGVVEHIDDHVGDEVVPISPGDTFVMHSDGITESDSPDGEMFGVERFENILNSVTASPEIFDKVMESFDEHFGNQALMDDVSLVTVPCVEQLFEVPVQDNRPSRHDSHNYSGNWCWSMDLSGSSLNDVDPVPIIIGEYNKLLAQPVSVMDLHNVLSELYKNAVEYGVFRRHRKDIERELRCNRDLETDANILDGCFVKIELEVMQHGDDPAVYLKIEDSGRGFDHAAVMQRVSEEVNDVSVGYGLSLVSSICESIYFNDVGNCVEVIMTADSKEV